MKKIHTLLLINMLLVCVLPIIAQNNVGIGTNTPDASAKIDISSTDKGLLIPRIALSSTTDAATIPNPATALLVYNTATAGTSPNNVTPGFYYNAGTAGVPVWTRLQTGSSNTDWNLNGNAGTNQPAVPAVYGTSAIGNTENWIGTRDAKDLVLGTNNKEGMRILQSNGNIGIGTATPAKKLEVANSDVLVYNLTVGRGGGGRYENTAIGSSALAANTSGDQNTAIGYHTLINNQTGRNNTSTGFEALVSNTSSYNTAFGSGALQNTATGLANDGFGFGAGNVNTTGNYNTYFGHFANPASNNLSNTTVIGANALVRSSNSLILGDTINGIRVGIGTTDPNSSAVLDMVSSNKGIRIPNVALSSTTDAVTIPNPATSLLIYNTASAGTAPNNVIPGYYYNTNTSASPIWTRFNTSAIADTLGWTKALTTSTKAITSDNQYVKGNVGIGDFSGSTPSDKLHIMGSMRVDAGRIGVYNTGRSVYIGRESGINDNFSTNLENVAMGLQTLLNNSAGNKNVAIGTFAMLLNTASSNVAVGHYGMVNNTTGTQNVALGTDALKGNSTGSNNVGIGQSALSVNITGSNNTALGYQANTGSNALTNATAIGSFATVRSNNSLVLGDTINGIRVGIGTTSPNTSTALDIVSSNKGIRIPNVTLTGTTDTTTIVSPAASLLVYNAATAGTAPNNVIPGYYYNSNTSASPVWTRLNTSAIADTLGWTKALTTTTKASKIDNQYVMGKIGVGDFSASTLGANLQVIGNGIIGANSNTITGSNSLVTGSGNTVSGNNIFVSGNANNAAGSFSVVLNNSNTTTSAATTSIAGGFNSYVSANLGTAIGFRDTTSAQAAATFGYENNATGENAFAAGSDNMAASYSETALGMYGTRYTPNSINAYNASDRILNIGNGAGPLARSDAFTILKNGNIGVNNNTPDNSAILDINAVSKGIRIPNIALSGTTDAATIPFPAASLLVYNTATAGTAPNNVIPGYYYNSNTSASPVWTRLNTSATADTLGWTKALTTSTKATRSDDQYVTGKVGIGNFSAGSPQTNLQVIGNGSVGARNLNVTGVNAFAVGDTNTVTGKNSFSVGQANTNAAESSIAGGYVSRIENGYGYSIALGFMDTVAASAAACFGYSNKITAVGGLTGGMNNKVTAPYSAAFGINNVISATSGLSLGSKNNTSGDNSISLGYTNFNGGENSIAAGYFTRIENSYDNSIVSGMTDTVAAALSAVFGWGNKTTGGASLISGERNKVTAYAGTALGRFNNADGEASFSSGIYTTAPSMAETSIGVYSTNYTPAGGSSVFAPTDRLFNVGNGTSISGRADAFTILKNGNIGIGTASPAYNITFANGANKTIGADRSATAATPYNLTIQASGALSGSTNNQGGDLVLSSGISTGSGVNGGDGASDPGSSIVFKTSGTTSPSSGTFDLAPDEKMRIRGDGTVKINSLAGTGNRKVYATATGNLSAREDLAYFDGRGNTYSQDNSNSGYRTIGSATNSITVNTGDVVAISVTSKFRWTGGSGTDHPYYGVRISGAVSTDLTDNEKLGYADDFPRGQWLPQSGQYIWVSNTNGSIQLQVIVDNNSDADDSSEYKDVVIMGTVH